MARILDKLPKLSGREITAVSERQSVKINLDRISEIALTGVRRAALFMGLGLNAVARDSFQDYQLHKLPRFSDQSSFPIEILPQNVPPNQIKSFKEEFQTWIIGNGLRELLEHYALCLDKIHETALFIYLQKGMASAAEADKANEKFRRRLGVPDKLEALNERFLIALNDSPHVVRLYEARNCLVHDLGIILPRRCAADGSFALTWRTLDIFAKGKDSKAEVPAFSLIGMTTEEEMLIYGRMIVRERKFAEGEKLLLSQQDLWEICFFFKSFVIPETINSLVRFLEAIGIPVERRSNGVPPLSEN